MRGDCPAPACVSSVSDAIFQSFPLSSNHVNDRENYNPDRVHEMPVERQDVDTLGMFDLTFPKSVNAITVERQSDRQ